MIEMLLLLALAGLMQAARSFTTVLAHGGTELAFGYLLLSAYFAGKVVNRFGLPRLTGYLLAGVIAGPFVFALVGTDMTGSLKIVSNAATCILGLGAGGELDLKKVRPLMATLRGLTMYAVVVAIVVLTGLLMLIRPLIPLFAPMSPVQSMAVCALLGVALAAQSPAVAMALLSETRADGPLSRLVLATVVVADLVVVIIYSIVAAIAGSVMGGEVDITETVLSIVWELMGSMVFGIVIGLLIGRFIKSVKAGASLFALLVCVVVAEIGTRVHLDPLLVMLAAGVWLRNFSKADANALFHGFESAELPVFLVFFALAGTNLNFAKLWTIIIPVLLIAVLRGIVFFFGARVACKRTHADPVITKYAWTGLVPQGALSLALVAVIQKNFKSFGMDAGILLLSVVGVNQLVAPVLLRISLIRSGEVGKAVKGGQ